ncbi:MAG TPA: hypothetical protein VGB77_14240 [Abditibacteriaceae bacterium]|jgi:hypothetical protein
MNDKRQWITQPQFTRLTQPLIGMPVSWTWRGYGSTVFLEFGKLSEKEKHRRNGSVHVSRRGKISAMIQVGWRVERPRSIAFGSDSGKTKIENGLVKLRERHVVQVSIEGRLPEIVFELSGGYWLHSFINWAGQPDWCLFFNKGMDSRNWVSVRQGKLELTTEDN